MEIVVTTAEKLREEGRKEGRIEGQEALRGAILRVLRSRFGALPEDVLSRLNGLSLTELEERHERALTARSLDDVLD